MNMFQRLRAPCAVLLFLFQLGCSSGGSDGSDGNGMLPTDFSGTWGVSLDGVVTQTCFGDLEGTVITFCDDYTATITQSENAVAGTFDAPCFPATGTLVGTVSGGIVTGIITLTTGLETTHTEFTATISGDTIVIMFTALTLDGFTGSCTLSGTWSGLGL